MPVVLPGSMTLGPRGGSSAPATMADYLTSIGKASWYGRFLASSGLAPNSDGSGGAVSDGGAVGCWDSIEAVSFAHKFTQSTSGSRPAYGVSRDGTPGIYGNASSWFMTLNSTTALNGSFTLLYSSWTVIEAAYMLSQASGAVAVTSASGSGQETLFLSTANAGYQMDQAHRHNFSTPSIRTRSGFTVTGTGHNGAAMNMLRRSSGVSYSSSTFYELVFCPALTAAQIAVAITYLA